MGNVEGTGAARSVTLPASLQSVSASRDFVRTAVDESPGIDVGDVLLMTSELVANVVRHTDSDITLTVRRGPHLRIEVHDGVAATDAFRELVRGGSAMPSVVSPGGRGLAIVRTLATRIGLEDDPDGGKVVWFEC